MATRSSKPSLFCGLEYLVLGYLVLRFWYGFVCNAVCLCWCVLVG